MYTIITMNLCQDFKIWYKNKRHHLVFPVLVFRLFLTMCLEYIKIIEYNLATSSCQWNSQTKASRVSSYSTLDSTG